MPSPAVARLRKKGTEVFMEKPTLVTWATRSGSTAEVAESIVATLRAGGLAVERRPMHDVQSLDGYGAVVLGIPLYMMRLHRDGRRFLTAFRKELPAHPVALFVLGPVHDKEEEFVTARHQLARQLAKFPWFAPVAEEVFGGRWDPSKLGFPFSILPAMKNVPASDARNWTAIHAWAETLRDKLPALQLAGS
jgi:menaquinone-dependent protoporphyrinogen oxidase